MSDELLQIKNLSVEYYRRKRVIPAVRNVSLTLNDGETLGIVGESGCGKSTLALAILRLIQPNEGKITTGEILFRNTDYRLPVPMYHRDGQITDYKNILKLDDEELQKIRGGKIAMIFQDPFTSLNPVIRIGEQIAETIRVHQQLAKSEERRVKKEVIEILKQVRIPEPERIYNSYPHQLSGGMQQRVMTGMAISSKPKILIADEPTTALDVTTQKEILELLNSLKKELDMSTILITHNFGIIAQYTNRVAIMYAGEIVEEGKTKEILSKPLHPYTSALIRSLPKTDPLRRSEAREKPERLSIIPGQVPDLLNLPSGCKFHPRCEKRKDICFIQVPEIKKVNQHQVGCFLF